MDRGIGGVPYHQRRYNDMNYERPRQWWNNETKRFIQNHGHDYYRSQYSRTANQRTNYRHNHGNFDRQQRSSSSLTPRASYTRQNSVRQPIPWHNRQGFQANSGLQNRHVATHSGLRLQHYTSRSRNTPSTTNQNYNRRPQYRRNGTNDQKLRDPQATLPPYKREPTAVERKRGISGDITETTCAICLDEMDEMEIKRLRGTFEPTVTFPCGHSFHGACAEAWVASKHTCPLCRSFVPPERLSRDFSAYR
nr:uncharacterized RING finger protein C2A9.04c-like [Ciona intestinalis]|eukprot:XP_002130047.1 uncharacterized RING finger protein C2A9.04c-like [Ciona intestinalis]